MPFDWTPLAATTGTMVEVPENLDAPGLYRVAVLLVRLPSGVGLNRIPQTPPPPGPPPAPEPAIHPVLAAVTIDGTQVPIYPGGPRLILPSD